MFCNMFGYKNGSFWGGKGRRTEVSVSEDFIKNAKEKGKVRHLPDSHL
jgi:hypothetical protein